MEIPKEKNISEEAKQDVINLWGRIKELRDNINLTTELAGDNNEKIMADFGNIKSLSIEIFIILGFELEDWNNFFGDIFLGISENILTNSGKMDKFIKRFIVFLKNEGIEVDDN